MSIFRNIFLHNYTKVEVRILFRLGQIEKIDVYFLLKERFEIIVECKNENEIINLIYFFRL